MRSMRRVTCFRVAMAMAVSSQATAAAAATVDVRCPAMPRETAAELETRMKKVFTDARMGNASIALECDASAAYLVWFDGSRAVVDQSAGLVEGAVRLVQDRLVT